jgi:hypothetical protein
MVMSAKSFGGLSLILIFLAALSTMPEITTSKYYDIWITVGFAFAGLTCAVVGTVIGIAGRKSSNTDSKWSSTAGLILCIAIVLVLLLILLALLAFSQDDGPILSP